MTGGPDVTPGVEAVGHVEALLANPTTRGELDSGTYVVEERRLLYVATPKAACTTLKSLLLRVAGGELGVLAGSTSAHPTAEMLVHDRERFPVPSLATLDPSARERALVEEGWLRFCVVRNPYARLYSAWEGKVLVGDPALLGRFGVPGVHDVVDEHGRLDVRATFRAFVTELTRRPEPYVSDPHFAPQQQVVRLGELPYTDVVRLEQIDAFLPRLRAHVVDRGGADPGDLPDTNSGLGISWREAYDAETAALAYDLYAEDFKRWGYDPREIWSDTAPRIAAGELALIRRIREMNERLAELSALAIAGTAADSERNVERAARLRIERHAQELAREHARLVERYEQLAAAHARLAGDHDQLGVRHAQLDARLAELDGRWRALEARAPVRLLRRLQRAGRRIRRSS